MTETYAGLSRAALEEFVDGYLEAVAANDPGRLRVAPDFRFTENGIPRPLGAGMWRTARKRWPGGHSFAEPEAGQIEWWGVVEEIAGPALVSLRLRVEAGLIREAETLVVRPPSALRNPEGLVSPRPDYLETVPESERPPREEMVRIANLYFEAIEQDDGSVVPVPDHVGRIENGIQTTRNPEARMEAGKMGVTEQMDKGFTKHISAIRDRRFPVVDRERGLVIAHMFFDHHGNLEGGGGRIPLGYPTSMIATELFKVRSGQIHNIEALIEFLPLGWQDGWPVVPD